MSVIDFENKAHDERPLLVWDAEGLPPTGDWITVLWSSFGKSNDPNIISIPMLVEEQADALKNRYLAWVYELGETHINRKRLVDHLELRSGLSYWWMTSLGQRFNVSDTSQINNAIKAFVLEKVVVEHKVKSIILVTANDKLAETIERLCGSLGLRFQWNPAKKDKIAKSYARRLYDLLPHPVKTLICFVQYLFKWKAILRTPKSLAYPWDGDISFIDVLAHLDKQAFTSGKFISNYWTALVNRLLRSNVKTCWFHNYFPQETIPSLVRAQQLIERFNASYREIQKHTLIEVNLDLSILFKALKDYVRTWRAAYRVSSIRRCFRPAGSALDLWPLFKQEWEDSLKGKGALVDCLRVSLYEKTFKSISHQKIGVYIQENQPWEMALIYAWRSAGHGKLIGVPHTTVRYWDLRYFYDPRSYNRTGNNDLPIPDMVAVNGPIAKRAYLGGGYPEHQVAEVEALRFLHLLDCTSNRALNKAPRKNLRVLVCGDFRSDTNFKILTWLSIAAEIMPKETSYILKSHPAYAMNIIDFPSLSLEMTEASLSELFEECDVVFTSNITSAAVDAYCSGLPVVQMLDGTTFNQSPLRGLKGVKYVTNPIELADALRNIERYERMMPSSYFHMDKDIPRWLKLLGINPAYSVSAAIV